jgi:hypothetical protein
VKVVYSFLGLRVQTTGRISIERNFLRRWYETLLLLPPCLLAFPAAHQLAQYRTSTTGRL